MAGLDRIKDQILNEAKEAAQKVLDAANAKASGIIAEANAQAEANAAEIKRKSDADIKSYRERVESSIDLKRRTAVLSAKQDMIGGVLTKAYEQVGNLGDNEYFALLKKLVAKYVQSGEGSVFLSQKDLSRLPAGFEKELNDIAGEKGGSLKIAAESKKIDNGFVLAYGGIEENCTLKAIFDEKKDALSDMVSKLLFS